ncbi:MAG: polysaccharide deacetylase family protein, partial [Janthinobacterium lividum]
MRTTAGATVLAASAAVGAAYWAGFGPRTQLWGAFPYRAASPAATRDPSTTGVEADRVVALTFDDGPNEPWTGRLLDVLAARDVHATFFQVGRCAERFPSTTRRVVE